MKTFLKPGRDVDRLIAEQVMNLQVDYGERVIEKIDSKINRDVYHVEYLVPNYSTDIVAAWEIVDFLTKIKGVRVNIDLSAQSCIINMEYNLRGVVWTWQVDAATAPMAICLAGLKISGLV